MTMLDLSLLVHKTRNYSNKIKDSTTHPQSGGIQIFFLSSFKDQLKNSSERLSGEVADLHFHPITPTTRFLALPISYTCQDLMTVCYVFIWTEPLHLVTGYHQPIHSLAKIKSSNYSLTNQGCFGFFFFQKVLNSINSSLTRNGKGLISRIIVLLLQFAVFKFSCWLDWKFYDIAYETSLTQLMLCSCIVLPCPHWPTL